MKRSNIDKKVATTAASYLAENTDAYAGLILLASYSTADIADSGLKVLSVYGSEGKVGMVFLRLQSRSSCKKQ